MQGHNTLAQIMRSWNCIVEWNRLMKGLTAEVNQINKKVEKKNLFFFFFN